jgi:hypothetical protein
MLHPPAPTFGPTAPPNSLLYPPPQPSNLLAVVHQFRRDGCYQSVVFYRDGLGIVQTQIGGGPHPSRLWSAWREVKLDRIAPLGPAGVAKAFPRAELIALPTIARVEMRPVFIAGLTLTILRNTGQIGVDLVMPKNVRVLQNLGNILRYVFGNRFVIDPRLLTS